MMTKFPKSRKLLFHSFSNLFMSDLIKGQGVLISACAFNLMYQSWLCSFQKIPQDFCEKMRAKETNNVSSIMNTVLITGISLQGA